MTATRTKILPHFFGFDRLSLVSPSKRYLHKWPQNTPFLPAPPAKQANHHQKTMPFLSKCGFIVATYLRFCLCIGTQYSALVTQYFSGYLFSPVYQVTSNKKTQSIC